MPVMTSRVVSISSLRTFAICALRPPSMTWMLESEWMPTACAPSISDSDAISVSGVR